MSEMVMQGKNAEELLNLMSGIEAAASVTVNEILQEQQQLLDAIITPEMQKKINDITAEYGAKVEAVTINADTRVKLLKTEITTLVIERGQTVRGNYEMAVYTAPQPMWDAKALEGYALAHPEILQLKRQSEARVSFRVLPKKE